MLRRSIAVAFVLVSYSLMLTLENASAAVVLEFTKLANGVDADDAADAPVIPTGELVTWTYQVKNSGLQNVDESIFVDDITIDDDNGTIDPVDDFQALFDVYATGDTDDLLEPGEVWLYTASGTAIAGGATNTATLTAVSFTTRTTVILSDFAIYVNDGAVDVPEPPTLALFAFGLVGLGFAARRRRG